MREPVESQALSEGPESRTVIEGKGRSGVFAGQERTRMGSRGEWGLVVRDPGVILNTDRTGGTGNRPLVPLPGRRTLPSSRGTKVY